MPINKRIRRIIAYASFASATAIASCTTIGPVDTNYPLPPGTAGFALPPGVTSFQVISVYPGTSSLNPAIFAPFLRD